MVNKYMAIHKYGKKGRRATNVEETGEYISEENKLNEKMLLGAGRKT
jgi:hypothetical protein